MFKSTSEQTIKELNINRLKDQERSRRGKMEDRSALLSGDFEHLISKTLQKQFSDPRHVQILTDVSCNVFKRVIEEVFKHPGVEKREFQNKAGEADPTFEQLKEDMSLDVWMQEIFKFMGAYNDCLVQILSTEQGESPYVRIFSPDEVTVMTHPMDPTHMIAVSYDIEDELTGDEASIVWTESEHYIQTKSGQMRPVAGSDDTINPYGFIPFVPVHGGIRSDCFWDCSTREDLVDFTLKYGASWSGLNHNRFMQSFKQPVLVDAYPGQRPPGRLGPDEMIVLEKSANGDASGRIEAIDLQIDIMPQVEGLQAQLGQKTSEYGLSADAFLRRSAAPQSGFSRALERKALTDRKETGYSFLVEAEYDVCDMLRAMWNFSNPGQLIPWESEFHIELAEEGTELSPIEEQEIRLKRLDVLEREIALGIRSKAGALAELENITIEEAQLRIDEIDAAAIAKAPPVQAPVDNNPFSGLMNEVTAKTNMKSDME